MISEKDYSARGWEVVPTFARGAEVPLELLNYMEEHPEAAGKSSWGTRNLLFSFILSMRPKVVLEIGAHIGSASVVMGAALKSNGFGMLYSLEPQDHYFGLVCEHVKAAGVESFVTPLQMFSTDSQLGELLAEKVDLIFLDANHSYSFAAQDIKIADELLMNNGLLILDDVGPVMSAQVCSEGKGGVRKALLDYVSDKKDLKVIFLEPPFWLNPCGIALVCKQDITK